MNKQEQENFIEKLNAVVNKFSPEEAKRYWGQLRNSYRTNPDSKLTHGVNIRYAFAKSGNVPPHVNELVEFCEQGECDWNSVYKSLEIKWREVEV